MLRLILLTFVFIVNGFIAFAQSEYPITKYGAKADGKTLNTRAIQKAIDAASKTHGKVIVPKGVYKTGTIYLKSNITLYLEAGAVILGSENLSDYPVTPSPLPIKSFAKDDQKYALIYALQTENVTITGAGQIDGNGAHAHFQTHKTDDNARPFTLRFIGCTNTVVSNISLVNSAMWMQHYAFCKKLKLLNLTVFNHNNLNNDGIDIDMCEDVLVDGCNIDSDDDGLCLKASGNADNKNITISNCIIRSNCNALKFGTASMGGLKNMVVTNCILGNATLKSKHWGRKMALAGIALESVDGGHIENVVIQGCVIDTVYAPFFVRLGARLRKVNPTDSVTVGSINHITFANIIARGCRPEPSIISGVPNHYITNIRFDNVFFTSPGDWKSEWFTNPIQEYEDKYPEISMFGKGVPAYGLFVRHAKNITLNNCTFLTEKPDYRAAINSHDVFNLNLNNVAISQK